MSPTLERSICLAQVTKEFAPAGTSLEVLLVDGRRITATVMDITPTSIPRESASVAETATTASTVSVTHVDPMPKASVRAATGTPAASALGLTFGSAGQRGDALVARVRPDEWYLLGDGARAMVDGLDLTGFASTVDLSHARHAVRVTGERAADTLAKLCAPTSPTR